MAMHNVDILEDALQDTIGTASNGNGQQWPEASKLILFKQGLEFNPPYMRDSV